MAGEQAFAVEPVLAGEQAFAVELVFDDELALVDCVHWSDLVAFSLAACEL